MDIHFYTRTAIAWIAGGAGNTIGAIDAVDAVVAGRTCNALDARATRAALCPFDCKEGMG